MATPLTIEESLQEIDAWLAVHAPRILHESLQPGVSAEELIQFENTIGKKLPDGFKKVYSHWNGASGTNNWGAFFYGMEFNSLKQVESTWKSDNDWINSRSSHDVYEFEKYDPEIDFRTMCNPNWLSIAWDSDSCYINVDLAPTERGNYGQVIFVDNPSETAILLANSIDEFMSQFANDLRKNLYRLNKQALRETNEQGLEPKPEIDILNWHKTKKWKRFA